MLKYLPQITLLLLLGSFLMPLLGQTASLQDRSYAYGYFCAKNLQSQRWSAEEMDVNAFVHGVKKSLKGDQATYEAAQERLRQRTWETKEPTTGKAAQELAEAAGIMALGIYPTELTILPSEFDFAALRQGYSAELNRKKHPMYREQMQALYVAQQKAWEKRLQEKRLQPVVVENALAADPKTVRDRSYAFGVQQAYALEALEQWTLKKADTDAFIEGVKDIQTADLKALIQSKRKVAQAHLEEKIDPNLAYHTGRMLLGTSGHAFKDWTKQMDLAALKSGFQTVVTKQVPKLNEAERNALMEPFLEQWDDQLIESNKAQWTKYTKASAQLRFQYAPQEQALDPTLEDAVKRRSYALGMVAVRIMGKDREMPFEAIQFDPFWKGMQEGCTEVVDAETWGVRTELLMEQNRQLLTPITALAHSHGQFLLQHLLGNACLGTVILPEDLDQAEMRRGFEAALNNQPLLLNKGKMRKEVRLYALLLVERMEQNPSSKMAQQTIQDRSYAYGFLRAEYHLRQYGKQVMLLDEVVRGIQDDAKNQVPWSHREAWLKLNPHKPPLANEAYAYVLGVLAFGTKHPMGTPLPTKAIDVPAFKAGYQAAMAGEEPRLSEGYMRMLETDYERYLERRYLQWEKEQIEAVYQAGEAFLQQNTQRPNITTTASGLQYEVLQKGNGQAAPTIDQTVQVHWQVKLIDGTVVYDTRSNEKPLTLPMRQMLKGCLEALKIMSPSAKYRLYLPNDLAYGLTPMDKIPKGSALVIDLELLDIVE